MERTPQAVAPRSAGAIILRDKPKNIGVARESPERGVRGEKLEVFSPVCGTAYQKKYDLRTELSQSALKILVAVYLACGGSYQRSVCMRG